MGAGVRGGGGSWGRLIITAVVSAVCTGAIVAAVCVWAFTPRWPQKLNIKKLPGISKPKSYHPGLQRIRVG